MLIQKPERRANNASLLAAIQSLFKTPDGHPFPTLDLAKYDGLIVYCNYIDLARTLPEVSFNYCEALQFEIAGGSFFTGLPTAMGRIQIRPCSLLELQPDLADQLPLL